MWDDFGVFREYNNKASVFQIGGISECLSESYGNPIKQAMQYRQMLDQGLVKCQADLARTLNVSRAKVTQALNILKLNKDIITFMLSLDDSDRRLKILTERKLRPLTQISDGEIQKIKFGALLSDRSGTVETEPKSEFVHHPGLGEASDG